MGTKDFISVRANGPVLVAATRTTVLVSTDKGTSWKQAPLASFITSIRGVTITPDEQILVASREGAFRSGDNGASWEHAVNGLPSKDITSIAYDSTRKRLLATSDATGVVFMERMLTDDAMKALLAYDWPGNVRELENCLERSCALTTAPLMQLRDLPTYIHGMPAEEPGSVRVQRKFMPMNRDAIRSEEADRYFFHFPDGNASIARLIVRQLIPNAIPGNSAVDVVTAQANYAKLDSDANAVRIRLNSTVVRVKHNGDPATAKEVEVTYSQGGKLRTVKGANCVLACWHVVIPYICEELPEKQKEALHFAQKVPLLYTNVELRNWTSFQKLATNSVYAPGSYHTGVNLDLPVSIGEYECTTKPEDPIVVHMMKAACKPGLPAREQHRMGRVQLYSTTFETFERNIRDQLSRTLGPGGFDPARDITAITVNRWPHGYAYEYNSLFDEFWLNGGETPCEVARRPHGRISIANSDAAAYAYTDAAIDQGYRAVQEITAKR